MTNRVKNWPRLSRILHKIENANPRGFLDETEDYLPLYKPRELWEWLISSAKWLYSFIDETEEQIRLLIFLVATAIILAGFRYSDMGITQTYFMDFNANLGTELIGILLTIFVIDALQKRRDDVRERKKLLVTQLGNFNNVVTREAVAKLRNYGWLEDATVRGADLRQANLVNLNLYDSDLRETNLGDVNLRGANLTRANLQHAYLGDADLTSANLSHADLRGADLSRAQLWGADLTGANFEGSKLERANLIESIVLGTNFSGASLKDSRLWDVDLTSATLTGSSLNGASISPYTELPENQDFERGFDYSTGFDSEYYRETDPIKFKEQQKLEHEAYEYEREIYESQYAEAHNSNEQVDESDIPF